MSTPLEGPKGLKRSTPSTLALPQPAVLFFRNGPPLESPIPRNSAAGSHAGWRPTWRSLASNAIPLPGPVLMLTVPAATFLLVLLLVIFSNLPSPQMLSAFLHRKAQRPPISHLLSTSHPPQATNAESAKSSPTEQKDTGPTCVTAINGILLPFLLRTKLRPAQSSSAANSTLFQIGLPLFPREDSLAEAFELPPLSMEHSFYMPVSAIRGLFSQLLTVPLYRQPNTLGWPYLFFFWLVAAWVKSRAERPSVSGVNRQLHVQIGCKLGIRNRKDELTKQAKRNELQINPKVIKGVNACRKRTRSS